MTKTFNRRESEWVFYNPSRVKNFNVLPFFLISFVRGHRFSGNRLKAMFSPITSKCESPVPLMLVCVVAGHVCEKSALSALPRISRTFPFIIRDSSKFKQWKRPPALLHYIETLGLSGKFVATLGMQETWNNCHRR